MRKFCLVLFGLFLCIDCVNAAVRTQNISTQSTSRQSRTKTDNTVNHSLSSRNVATQDTTRKTTSRATSKKVVTGRTGTGSTKRIVTPVSQKTSRNTRAATTVKTRTFGTNYNSCRDAYFTCMDQFCATQNEDYRRCVCSSKLKDIQNQEKLLSQTSDSLKDFQDLNINMISKTSKEVKAMLSASEGETEIKKDKSESANTLKSISGVLSNTKSTSISNQGKLDIVGDIKSVWSTTDLIGGADIANLTGEALFNAVHTQCSELVAQSCGASDLKMVASAYGMYIENDCSLLETNIKNKKTSANAAIRGTRHNMQDARLENYNVHNSVNMTDCIANVRKDITANTACGEKYIHCLDFSGKYLNSTSGAPIYTPEFYQIENQISLSGDVLKNSQNVNFLNMLNKKRHFATKSLDACRDNADDVWDEFLRQALVEIYQGQQERVKTVKNECLQVVNDCYLKQSDQLKSFSDTDGKISLGEILELSEEMCADKLNTCSNLYGGGDTGFELLIATMTGITNATIEQTCPDMLATFAKNICSVTSGKDTMHSYPYGCRKYAPGEARYARINLCNKTLVNPFSKTNILLTNVNVQDSVSDYLTICEAERASNHLHKVYISCKYGKYLFAQQNGCDLSNPITCYASNNNATRCEDCPSTAICPGGKSKPISKDAELYNSCGQYYVGSLYQQLARYAIQNCKRPSDTSYTVSETLLTDIDNVMVQIRTQMSTELAKECENQSGTWVDVPWEDNNNDGLHDTTNDSLLNNFYTTTGTNALWGYCKP